MTAKEFVKQHYPKARSERYKTKSPFGESYNLIWSNFASFGGERIGEGENESKAWTNAKQHIISRQQLNQP